MDDATPDFAELVETRNALREALRNRGMTYHYAMLRYAWQMNWDKNREAHPPAIETLSVDQLRHLISLLTTNHQPKENRP